MEARLHSREWNFEGQVVRTCTGNDGEPRFVATDICRVLKLSNPSMAISRLDEDEKEPMAVPTPGGPREMLVVNESGFFALLLTSHEQEARRLGKWVTSEVLPTLRKTGRYGIMPEESDPILSGIRAMDDVRRRTQDRATLAP